MPHSPISPAAALLVIDLQTGMFDGVHVPPIQASTDLVARVQQVIAWARRTGRPVAFIRHDAPPGEILAPGAPGWPVLPALGQGAAEPTFGKSEGNAFTSVALVDWITAIDPPDVILVGAQSEHCVTATLHGAMARGLAVTVIADAHSSWDDGHRSAAQIIAECNTAFTAAGARLMTTASLIDP